jgi:hypothetical protein
VSVAEWVISLAHPILNFLVLENCAYLPHYLIPTSGNKKHILGMMPLRLTIAYIDCRQTKVGRLEEARLELPANTDAFLSRLTKARSSIF